MKNSTWLCWVPTTSEKYIIGVCVWKRSLMQKYGPNWIYFDDNQVHHVVKNEKRWCLYTTAHLLVTLVPKCSGCLVWGSCLLCSAYGTLHFVSLVDDVTVALCYDHLLEPNISKNDEMLSFQ
jgi:hypothetical protein